ncbi:MAG: GNAT family N-acetyltransferase [Nocardioidaceae bacterium]|nr:GNAT family N-acetyltransferase [Nocardioidaceae bacterium]NUS53100.1 GNAT family N-acetyltransferase [Nocardioidaceae bacterium]
MNLAWVPEAAPAWDADKQRVIGGAPAGTFVIPFADGDPLPGEWWVVRDRDAGDRVVGYGRLDIGWGGDAEILLAVDPGCQQQGVGSFVLQQLEEEAAGRGINYVYNTIREHEGRELVHDWLVVRGFRGAVDGDLRKRVGNRVPPSRPRATDATPYDPATSGDLGPGREEAGAYVDIEDHRY